MVGGSGRGAWGCVAGWGLLVAVATVGAAEPSGSPGRLPNIVLILSDDQAYGDYGFMGHPHIRTPHLDALAAQSVVFTRGYTPTSLCRPSLMTILTGQYPHQHGVTGNDPPAGTDRREMLKHIRRAQTLPKWLSQLGYVSFQTGKWWEGHYSEGGFTQGMTHGDPARRGRHGDEGLRIGREGLQPIYDFLAARNGRPFFLWFAPMMPHTPHNPPPQFLELYRGQTDSPFVARYYAMCTWWDQVCGELLKHLDEQGLADNTLVIYVTDNGWIQNPTANGFAPRSKRTPYEGGIRTPVMLRWPGRLAPRRDDATLVSTIDLVPTILAACGVTPPAALPGRNLLEVATGRQPGHEAVFGEIYAHDVVDIDRPERGLEYRWCIAGAWKLIESADGKTQELYQILDDPREERNLAGQHPEKVRELSQRLKAAW